ncbi:MAG: NAD(P) transhydrogenase subunit alpha [Alphaproteobacteria bacterium]|nr:NAD(P) transhydrogenase subunit alpha [Alphaproteobacteria bacterium]
MALDQLQEKAEMLAQSAAELAQDSQSMVDAVKFASQQAGGPSGVDPLLFGITVLILACFVGYYVVWRVTPALHSPLMGVTNAISSVIIVGALIAAGPAESNFSQMMGFNAVVLASVNIFAGFIVTQRMLAMFKRKGD